MNLRRTGAARRNAERPRCYMGKT